MSEPEERVVFCTTFIEENSPMKKFFSLYLLLAANFYAHAQTGFFLMAEDRDCSHKVTALDSKQYCITDQPIIDKSEFKAEGNLQREVVSQRQCFNLRFTKAGFEKLKVICDQLPDRPLIFVVNG